MCSNFLKNKGINEYIKIKKCLINVLTSQHAVHVQSDLRPKTYDLRPVIYDL